MWTIFYVASVSIPMLYEMVDEARYEMILVSGQYDSTNTNLGIYVKSLNLKIKEKITRMFKQSILKKKGNE